MQERLVRTLVLFILLTVLLGLFQRLWPSVPKQPTLRRGYWLDVAYWFITPLFSQILSMVSIAVLLLPFYLLLGRSLTWNSIIAGQGPMSVIPIEIQGLIAIVVGDFIGYWTHRWHHTRQLWDIHAVHHSSETLDWLSAVRLHPFNDVITHVAQASPLLLLGLSPLAVEFYTPFLSAYVAMIHANISWNYGPFKYFLSSPAFHRWHHTLDKEGEGKNFAGLFPIYDLIFGTFYMPSRQPANFGLGAEKMTESFIGQLLYPLRHLSFLKLPYKHFSSK